MDDAVAVELKDIQAAARRIAPHVIRTPTLHSESLSQALNCQLSFKAENLQYIGAFKARGATNAVMRLDDEVASRGVVTHSSGNHAAALSRAARLRDIPAFVVMPDNSARKKIEAVRSFGVEPVFCQPTAESRAETAEALRLETGATLVHPYDDPFIVAGQGTVGLEILDQLTTVEMVVVPVGGGGLLAGVLLALKSLRPDIQVIAAEPEWADDAARSLQSGQIELPTRYDSVADGLRTPLGELNFPIIRSLLDEIVLVSEGAIRESVRTLVHDLRMVVEPSGAVSLAAIRTSPERFRGKTVAAIISGGNLDLPSWLSELT